MRFFVPALLVASPALAHPAGLPHAHTSDWAVPIALATIVLTAVVARRRAMRIRK